MPALLVAATAMGAGLPAGSALLFGVSTAAMGLVFAGVTGVAVQFTQHSSAPGGIAAPALFGFAPRTLAVQPHPALADRGVSSHPVGDAHRSRGGLGNRPLPPSF
ncbi:hypothetical protein [Spongiactinospora sp. 9N601]|uniref:hypothetical protein n=1 Tax=Spongiactinospora sp. 9N601 TaxID=3375149 RepID=UPI00378BF4F3